MTSMRQRLFAALALCGMLALTLSGTPRTLAQTPTPGSQTFPETGQTVTGKILDFWNTHGGLTQLGYPISAEMQDVSATDGMTYTLQYFERAVLELHPENAAPYDVEGALLGVH